MEQLDYRTQPTPPIRDRWTAIGPSHTKRATRLILVGWVLTLLAAEMAILCLPTKRDPFPMLGVVALCVYMPLVESVVAMLFIMAIVELRKIKFPQGTATLLSVLAIVGLACSLLPAALLVWWHRQ